MIILLRRKAQIDALNRYYAVQAFNYFRSVQPSAIGRRGTFWTNQTGQAAVRVFTRAFSDGNDLGWLIAHGVDYGVYLEKANNGQNAALWPIIRRYAGRYMADVKRLFE